MSKGYSGRCDFTFEVDRYRDKETGELYLEENLPEEDSNFEYVLIPLNVSGNAYFMPGNYTGAWEDSYPDESDTEIESVLDKNGNNWIDKLSTWEMNSILSDIADAAKHASYDYDPYDDEETI